MSRSGFVKLKPRFNVTKATQVAGKFLKLLGGRDYYLLLIKLMYLAERSALLRWGRTLTFDDFVSMKHGPVPSATLDLLKRNKNSQYWATYISEPKSSRVALELEPENDELSDLETELIQEVFEKYGHWNRYYLRDYTHTLPEYTLTTSSIPIGYQEILKAGGLSGEDIARVMAELESLAALEDII